MVKQGFIREKDEAKEEEKTAKGSMVTAGVLIAVIGGLIGYRLSVMLMLPEDLIYMKLRQAAGNP